MTQTIHRDLEVIAMHGWASDARCWEPWKPATEPLGWRWQCGERGYGTREPVAPSWTDAARTGARLVIGHSLGPHLLDREVLCRADAVVLLASFGAFVPPGRVGRRARAALDAMAAKLGNEEDATGMLRKFLANAASPEPADLIPAGPVGGPLCGLSRLREDLALLARCEGLPAGFPQEARVLIVEAEDDKIVDTESREMLRGALPDAEVVRLKGAGHALLKTNVIGTVLDWVQACK